MTTLTKDKIGRVLAKIEKGLRKYCWLQANLRKCDVSRDETFQTRFNGFYRVRRDSRWRDCYYRLMQAAKDTGITFPEAIRELRDLTGRIEASFASKLVATLDPTRPVIDKFVLSNFGLRLPYPYESNRESRTTGVYNDLCGRYEAMLNSSVGDMVREQFRERYPWAEITDLKMIDLVLWQIRDSKT